MADSPIIVIIDVAPAAYDIHGPAVFLFYE